MLAYFIRPWVQSLVLSKTKAKKQNPREMCVPAEKPLPGVMMLVSALLPTVLPEPSSQQQLRQPASVSQDREFSALSTRPTLDVIPELSLFPASQAG